jgi:hypothetical protein
VRTPASRNHDTARRTRPPFVTHNGRGRLSTSATHPGTPLPPGRPARTSWARATSRLRARRRRRRGAVSGMTLRRVGIAAEPLLFCGACGLGVPNARPRWACAQSPRAVPSGCRPRNSLAVARLRVFSGGSDIPLPTKSPTVEFQTRGIPSMTSGAHARSGAFSLYFSCHVYCAMIFS